MKCQSELQAYAEAGHKPAGSAKRSFLLIAHIRPAARGVQQPFDRPADWEQTDKTVCRDDLTHALMNCLVLCVRRSDTWHEDTTAACEYAQRQERRESNSSHSIRNRHMCVMIWGSSRWSRPHACIGMSDGFSRVCLPNFAGFGVWVVKGKDSVCVWEIIDHFLRCSVLCWHTAGHPAKESKAPSLTQV